MNRSKRWPPRASRRRLAALCGGVLLLAAPAAAQEAPAAQLAVVGRKFQGELERIAQETPGVVGISVVDLTSGDRFAVNEQLVFAQGSAIKVTVLVELFRQAEAGRLRLDERVTLRAADRAGGSGVLQQFGDGSSQLALRDLAVLMIVLSDNTATNLLIDRVGMDSVNRTLRELGASVTRLQRRMIRPADSAVGRENISTPAEAAALMGRIARCELPMSADRCAELRAILSIPRPGTLSDPIPPGVPVTWKSGSLDGVSTAWGVVSLPGRPFVVAAMVNYGEAASAAAAIGRVSTAALQHFSRLAGVTPYGTRVPLRYLHPDSAAAPPRR